MYYYIRNTLEKAAHLNFTKKNSRYVAVLTAAEWLACKDQFDMGIEMDIDLDSIHSTKAEVNYDSLTGSFCVPDRSHISEPNTKFAFALDEKGIVFIDDSGFVQKTIEHITACKRWAMPSLERFIYDFLEQIIHTDLSLLERYEGELDEIDKEVAEDRKADLVKLDDIRWYLRELKRHYDHLIDLAQELEENENNFFKANNIRYFKLFSSRVSRLYDMVNSLLDYSMQIRDTYESKLDVKQNSIMTVLTVVTTIFMPLTLIAGWYGMNFRYMPELESKFGYPGVIIVSILIAAGCLIYFKHKKWL